MALTIASLAKFQPHGQHVGMYVFTITYGATPTYLTGGNVVDLAPLNALFPFSQLQAIFVQSSNGTTVNYIKGATLALGKFQIWNGITEIANGAANTNLVLTCVAFLGTPILQ